MDLNLSVNLTQKGADEVKTRTHKLNIKSRSILLLLERPQTIQYVLGKVMFPLEDLMEALTALVREGFVQIAGAGGATVNIHTAPKAAHRPSAPVDGSFSIQLHEDIVYSEARFLLINYCVDTFGTKSQSFVDSLGLCKTVAHFSQCVKQIFDFTKDQYPQHLGEFQSVVQEVNKTAA